VSVGAVQNLVNDFDSVPRNLYQEKFLDSQLSIQQWQHYIIGKAALDINLGKTNKIASNMQLLANAYKKQAEGQAEGIWKFMLHPKGGGKDARWTNGRDVNYLRDRLMHKDQDCQNEADSKYLWNQWLDSIRPAIDNEAMPAWNQVTANGVNMQVSGCDFMTIHDRVMQMWYEISLDRVKKVDGKTTPAVSIKEDSLKQWQKISGGDKEGASAAVCPLNHCGHGDDCPYGRAPPGHPMPKSYLFFWCAGPGAQYLADYYSLREQPDDGHFPPFAPDAIFAECFKQTTRGLPPPNGPDGGAMKQGRNNMSRLDSKRDDMKQEEDDFASSADRMCEKMGSAADAFKVASEFMCSDKSAQNTTSVADDAAMLTARVSMVTAASSVKVGTLAEKMLNKLLAVEMKKMGDVEEEV